MVTLVVLCQSPEIPRRIILEQEQPWNLDTNHHRREYDHRSIHVLLTTPNKGIFDTPSTHRSEASRGHSHTPRMADKPRGLEAAAYRYNCQPCKQRKTKCDRVKPCASCQLRGIQDKCYIDGGATSETCTAAGARSQKKARFSYGKSDASSSNVADSASDSSLALPASSPQRNTPSVASPIPLPSTLSQVKTSAIQDHIATLRATIDHLESSILPRSTSRNSSPSRCRSSRYIDAASSSQLVLTTNPRVVWTDVAHLFPPKHDVERILEYFLTEMVYIMIPIQEKQLWRAWLRLTGSSSPAAPAFQDNAHDPAMYQSGISRPMVASLLICLASTSFLIPQKREQELGLTCAMAEQRDRWITCAMALARGVMPTNSATANSQQQPWLHYIDSTLDTSLDMFGFETLACRIFALIGMSEVAYHLNGECLRRAIRINLYDETSAKACELLSVDDAQLTDEEVVQMRRRIGAQMVVIERWTCLYTGRQPMIDEDAETLPCPEAGAWLESEEIAYLFSRIVSKLRRLPTQLASLTTRKPGDWSIQRSRDQEAVQLILDLDRALCAAYDPSVPRATANGRSHTQILADLPEMLERNLHLSMSDTQINKVHRDFANALVLTSSWLSLRCLVTSNLMFLPWVSDVASRHNALNLARRLIELLPSIWMMASSPYVPFSSSWISRHLFLACTVLSVPILGQEPTSSSDAHARADKNRWSQKRNSAHVSAPGSGSVGDAANATGGDFAPSRMQSNQMLAKLSWKHVDSNSALQRLPASSSVDLDWFSGKLVEIASLFSKLAERGDQTAGVNTKLIHALLNGRAELRDRVLLKFGQKQNRVSEMQMAKHAPHERAVGRFESQLDLTSFVAAASIGTSPSSTPTSAATNANANSPVHFNGGGVGGGGGASARGYSNRPMPNNDVLVASRDELVETQRVRSPSLHDLANAVDTYTQTNCSHAPAPTGAHMSGPSSVAHPHRQSQHRHDATTTAIGCDWDKPGFSPCTTTQPDALANIPLLLETHDWLAILDSVDIPL